MTKPYPIKAASVDEYIAAWPEETQKVLKELREKLLEWMPHAHERISYAMPSYQYGRGKRDAVWFAAYKTFVGLYIPPNKGTLEKYAQELAEYKTTKSAVQFPLSRPLPYTLIKKIVIAQSR